MKTIRINGKTAEAIIAELLEAGFVQNQHTLKEGEITHIKAWVRDLRSNPKKACDRMIEPLRGGRCCLMVACDTATLEGCKINRDKYTPDKGEFARFYGVSSIAVLFTSPTVACEDPRVLSFAEFNDGTDFTYHAGEGSFSFVLPDQPHSVIADLIEILLLGRDAPSHD